MELLELKKNHFFKNSNIVDGSKNKNNNIIQVVWTSYRQQIVFAVDKLPKYSFLNWDMS